jgi:hypothetical protein
MPTQMQGRVREVLEHSRSNRQWSRLVVAESRAICAESQVLRAPKSKVVRTELPATGDAARFGPRLDCDDLAQVGITKTPNSRLPLPSAR